MTQWAMKRQLTLVCRRAHRSHAANAFLEVAQERRELPGQSPDLRRGLAVSGES